MKMKSERQQSLKDPTPLQKLLFVAVGRVFLIRLALEACRFHA